MEGDNDDSFVSYTEMKLDQLYKESHHLFKQIKNLDEKCMKENNGVVFIQNHEARSHKLEELEKKNM